MKKTKRKKLLRGKQWNKRNGNEKRMRVAYESEEGQGRRETSGKRGECRDERGGIRSRKERRPGEWDIERRRDADPRKP